MNIALVHNWNEVISKNDTVYLLGDISNGIKIESANELISKLKGHKILIKGNHDKKYDESLFKGIYDFYELKGVSEVAISLMHYPMLEWPKSRYGSLHLHGHQHNNFEYNLDMKNKGIRRFDVGVDANNYFPVSLNFILDFFDIKR